MSHQNRLHVFLSLLIAIVLVLNTGSVRVSAASSEHSTLDSIAMPTLLETPTFYIQTGAEPEAWLDESIDMEQFGPMQALTIHFNTPMSPESSPHPMLSWPSVEGVSNFYKTQKVLSFKRVNALYSMINYSFFMDLDILCMDCLRF
jgi:hypothetical protein